MKTPTVIIQEKGVRRIDERHLADLVCELEGQQRPVDRAQVGECVSLTLRLLGRTWAKDPVAVVETLERHK